MNTYLVTRWEPVAHTTVAELMAWCTERGIDPATVQLVHDRQVKYTVRETAEERDVRLARSHAAEERWERELWQTLEMKYGTPTETETMTA